MEELERELAEVPLGELQKARADGSHVPPLMKLRDAKKLGRSNKNRFTLRCVAVAGCARACEFGVFDAFVHFSFSFCHSREKADGDEQQGARGEVQGSYPGP